MDNTFRVRQSFLPGALSWKMAAAALWLLFSLALAGWWLVYGLGQIDQISRLAQNESQTVAAEIARRHRMWLSEGATLILLLLGGGIALLREVRSESRRANILREFFAAFTHDLKTSLASLRLQAESLEIDSKGSEHEDVLRRLVKDTVRLELQLENSLLLARPDESVRFFLEPIRLSRILEPMNHQWPELKIEITGDATVLADQRALESILKNLLQNSVVHGHAKVVSVKIERENSAVLVHISDNGRGFSGDAGRLGRIFERHGTSSGSGLGLYLASGLALRMGGNLRFPRQGTGGFSVDLTLPGTSS